MSLLNKKIIQNNFTKNSSFYEEHAEVQKFAVDNLFEQINFVISTNHFKNKKILDLGSGTGLIGNKFRQFKLINNHILNNFFYEVDLSFTMLKNSKNYSYKINADIENLPFKDHQFDLILTSFALHWLNNFSDSIKKISQILKNSAVFAIAIPSAKSFNDLKKDNPFFLNNFIDYQEILEAFQKTQLQLIKTYHNQFSQQFPNQISALKNIKKIGANYSQLHDNNHKEILLKNNFQNQRDFYKKNLHNSRQNFTLNWQIDYLILKKID